jgi:alginate O-acetyltransferase complex protein AlgI
VYFPLGGSRVPVPRHYLNLLITFAVTGLGHGANWTFVLWGLYNGALLITEIILGRWYLRQGFFWTTARRIATLAFVIIGWVSSVRSQ